MCVLVCMCTRVWVCPQNPEENIESPGVEELQVVCGPPDVGLGPELRLSAGAASAPNSWVISVFLCLVFDRVGQ